VTLAVLVAVIVVALADAAQSLPALRQAWNLGLREFLEGASLVASRPVPEALLLPARLLVRPTLAEDWGLWLSAMLPAAALLAAHYLWVIRSDAAFEEAAAASALARSRTRARSARVPRVTASPVPRLAVDGWPAGALMWKNLAAILRAGRARSAAAGLGVAGMVVLGLSLIGRSASLLEIVGWMSAMWAAFLFVLGPQWIRNDLRADLARLGVLRSYPLPGSAIVAAETAGSTAVLTALQLGLGALAWLAFWGSGVQDPAPALRTGILLAGLALLPAVNFLAMLIQNGAAILLPGWVSPGADRPIGVEALGHHMLLMSGFLLLLAALLLIPTAAAAGILLGLKWLGWWAVPPAAAVAVGLIALEARLLLARLGRVFEGTDPSTVPPAEHP
jgi:hypothetical protein